MHCPANLQSISIHLQTTLAVGVSLGFFYIGLVRGFSSPAIPSIRELNPQLLPDKNIASWVSSIPPFGAFLGSLLAAPLNHKFGRKRTLLLATPIGIAAWLTIALSRQWMIMFTGRLLCGFCVGLKLPSAQIYVSECCDTKIRGILGSFPSIFMSFGILFFYILGSMMPWNWLAWTGVLVSSGYYLVVLSLPESPVWLKAKKRYEEAEQSAEWLKLSDFKPTCDVVAHTAPPKKYKSFELKAICRRTVLIPLLIGLVLLMIQQLSGIDSVIFFTVEIFKTAGSSINGHLASIIVGLVQLLSNISSLFVVDRFGRKPLLLASGVIMSVSMGGMGYAFHLNDIGNKDYRLVDVVRAIRKLSLIHLLLPSFSFLPLLSLMVFMMGFSIGFGSIPYLLMGELFPTKQRGILSSFAGSFNLLIMFTVIVTYHPLEESISTAGTFYMYAILCFLGVIFVVFVVPETKGKSLESITLLFAKKKAAVVAPTPHLTGCDNLGNTIVKEEVTRV